MKKLIIALFASFLFSPFAYSVSEPEIPIPTDPTGEGARRKWAEAREESGVDPHPNPIGISEIRKPFPGVSHRPPRPKTCVPSPVGSEWAVQPSLVGSVKTLQKDKADGKDPEKPEVGHPEPKPRFPAHWGRPPEIQTADPAGFGASSRSLDRKTSLRTWVVPSRKGDCREKGEHFEEDMAEFSP